MMARSAQTLYRLQLLDSELSEQRSRLRETESLLGESQELLAARQAHDEVAGEQSIWRGRLRDLEWDLQKLTEKVAATEQSLYAGRVTNPKELGALQQDHDHLKRSRVKLEDEVLAAMTRLEECEKAVTERAARRADVEARWQDGQAKLTREAETRRARIAALSENRKQLTSLISATDLALYDDLLRKKGGRAVALLVGSMCQGCRVTVPTSKAHGVRQGQDLFTCTNCGRILIVEQ